MLSKSLSQVIQKSNHREQIISLPNMHYFSLINIKFHVLIVLFSNPIMRDLSATLSETALDSTVMNSFVLSAYFGLHCSPFALDC